MTRRDEATPTAAPRVLGKSQHSQSASTPAFASCRAAKIRKRRLALARPDSAPRLLKLFNGNSCPPRRKLFPVPTAGTRHKARRCMRRRYGQRSGETDMLNVCGETPRNPWLSIKLHSEQHPGPEPGEGPVQSSPFRSSAHKEGAADKPDRAPARGPPLPREVRFTRAPKKRGELATAAKEIIPTGKAPSHRSSVVAWPHHTRANAASDDDQFFHVMGGCRPFRPPP